LGCSDTHGDIPATLLDKIGKAVPVSSCDCHFDEDVSRRAWRCMECRRLYSVSFYEYIYMIHAPRCRNLLVAQLNQAYQIIFPDMQGYARRDLSSRLSTTISDCTLWIFVVEGSFAHRQSGVDDIFLKLKISFIPHGYHWTALIRAEGFTWLRDFKSCHTECLSFG